MLALLVFLSFNFQLEPLTATNEAIPDHMEATASNMTDAAPVQGIAAECGTIFPYIYVYDIPTTLLSAPTDFNWRRWEGLEFVVWQSMSTYECTTKDPAQAQFFFIPHITSMIYEQTGYDRSTTTHHFLNIIHHVIQTWPYFNQTSGINHVTAFGHDYFRIFMSEEDYKSIPLPVLRNVIFIINQGYDSSSPAVHVEFYGNKDIIVAPPTDDIQAIWESKGAQRKPWAERPHLFMFRGTIYPENLVYSGGVRQKLYEHYLLDPEVIYGEYSADYYMEFMDAKFCLYIMAWAPWSERLADILSAACIPVVISDNYLLPYWQDLDWRAFSFRIAQADVLRNSLKLKSFLRNVTAEQAERMESYLQHQRHGLVWHLPPQQGDAFYRTMKLLGKKTTTYRPLSNDFWTPLE